MAWKSKQPWSIGAAACEGLAVAGVGAYVWNEKSAFAASQTGEQHQHNDAVMGQVSTLKNEWSQKVNQGQFDQQKTQIEQSMALANARKVWPMLTLDIYQSLPQAQLAAGAATRPASAGTQPGTVAGAGTQPGASHEIVVTHILSDYSGALSTVNLSGTAAALPTPAAPTPMDNGDSENPAPPVAPSTPVNPALAATQGPSDHGFVVTITGYVPDVPGVELYDVVQEYMKTLLARHPVSSAADPNTLYYFTDFTSSGLTIPTPVPGADPSAMGDTTGVSPWAKGSGPFKEVYARELSGAKPQPPQIGPGPNGEAPTAQSDMFAQGNFGGPIDAFVRDPETGDQVHVWVLPVYDPVQGACEVAGSRKLVVSC